MTGAHPLTTHPHPQGAHAPMTATITTSTPDTAPGGKRLGRPLDPTLADRFLTAGVKLLGSVGLYGLTVDGIVAEVHAGKAGFYRRWPSVDAFLADLINRLRAGTLTGLDADAVAAMAGERVRALAEAGR